MAVAVRSCGKWNARETACRGRSATRKVARALRLGPLCGRVGRCSGGVSLVLVDSHDRVSEFDHGVVEEDDLDRDNIDAVADHGHLLEGDRAEAGHVERFTWCELVPDVVGTDRQGQQAGALSVAEQCAVAARDVRLRLDPSRSDTGSSEGCLGDLCLGVAALGARGSGRPERGW
jgi:hypothetical protein